MNNYVSLCCVNVLLPVLLLLFLLFCFVTRRALYHVPKLCVIDYLKKNGTRPIWLMRVDAVNIKKVVDSRTAGNFYTEYGMFLLRFSKL